MTEFIRSIGNVPYWMRKQPVKAVGKKYWCNDCCAQHEIGKHFTKEQREKIYRGEVK